MQTIDVTRAIVEAVSDAFPGQKVYTKNNQGLKPPCFVVLALNNAQDKLMNRRFSRAQMYDVHYFPVDAADQDECQAVGNKLLDILELLSYDGMRYRGTGMNFEVTNGIMHFFVNYNFHVMRPKPESEKMARLEQEGRIK